VHATQQEVAFSGSAREALAAPVSADIRVMTALAGKKVPLF